MASPVAPAASPSGGHSDLPPAHSRTVVHAHPAEAIIAAARPADFDAVIVVARSRSVLGQLFHHSVTAQVVCCTAACRCWY